TASASLSRRRIASAGVAPTTATTATACPAATSPPTPVTADAAAIIRKLSQELARRSAESLRGSIVNTRTRAAEPNITPTQTIDAKFGERVSADTIVAAAVSRATKTTSASATRGTKSQV